MQRIPLTDGTGRFFYPDQATAYPATKDTRLIRWRKHQKQILYLTHKEQKWILHTHIMQTGHDETHIIDTDTAMKWLSYHGYEIEGMPDFEL